MASTISQSSLARGVIPFALKDGTPGIIAPEARRVYDHIIHRRVGSFPANGLTDTQAKLILSASCLTDHEMEAIWKRTEAIDAPGLADGYWTQLELYVALSFVQASEKLSLDQMAIQFAGDAPPESTNEIRRRSSYAEAGLTSRAATNHDPMPSPPSPPLTTFLRRSVSNGTSLTGMIGHHPTQAMSNGDNASLSQPGLEILEPHHAGTALHLGGSGQLERDISFRSDTTIAAQRLASLIQSRCPNIRRDPDIERFWPRPTESSGLDRLAARDVLVRKRRDDPKFKDPSKTLGNKFKSKEKKQKAANSDTWVFGPHELSLALREAVESGDIVITKALIDMGADVNSFKQVVKSKLKGSRVNSIPTNYAKIAASHNNADMVSLLAISGASPNYLLDVLEHSVEHNLQHIVLSLLHLGVDWSSRSESIFGAAIASQDPALIRLLLRSRSRVNKDLLTRNLPIAVEQGQTEIVSLLVTYEANTGFENASALRKAVQLQRIDLVLAIMKGIESNVRSVIASSVVSEAFSTSSLLTQPEQRLLIDILLCAGARGDPVARILVQVVRAGNRSIAKLLVKHSANLHYNNAEALRVAIATEKIDMLSTLLMGNITKEVASSAVDDIPHACSEDRMHTVLSLLITKGASGPPLNRALVRAVQRKYHKALGLLLDHQANVNVENSQPLRMAASDGDEFVLNMLLSKGRPHPESMHHLLPLIPQSPLQLRLTLTESIIKAAGQNGIPASVLNNALLESLKRRPSQEDVYQSLIPLADVLITAGASADFQRGKCFRLAAEIGSMKLFELLLSAMSEPSSLSPAMSICMKMKDSKQRREFVSILLKHGANGVEVNQALIDAIEERAMDKILVQSLLEKADLEYLGGQALAAAMRRSSVDLVASIIETGRTSNKTRVDAGQILFEPSTKHRKAKMSLLLRSGIKQEDLNNALVREISGERDSHVIKLLLDHKASPSTDGGKPLEVAILHRDDQVLEQLIARRPSRHILETMVPKAMALKDVTPRRSCLGLLIRGGVRGESVSHALIQEVETPGYRDPQLIQILVDHGARIDYWDARAIKFVVTSPSHVDLLKILASGVAASTVIALLVPLAMKHGQESRLSLLQVLLEKGASGVHVDEALVSAVSEGIKSQPTIDLLLKYNASVNHNMAEAVKVAALAKSNSILECLLSKGPDPEYIEEAVKLAMQSPSSPSKEKAADRNRSIRLLTRPKVVKPGTLDSPLVQAVQEKDYELIEYLIGSGADPNSRDGRSLVIAAQQLNTRSLSLLFSSKTKPASQNCSRAFSSMPLDGDRWQSEPQLVHDFDKVLIAHGAAGSAVDQAFLSAVRSSHVLAASFISLVLKYKTALNADFESGRSIRIAARRARFQIVDYFLLQRPSDATLRAAFMSIFESDAEEQVLVQMAAKFLKYSNRTKHIYFEQDEPMNNALYQTLHRHPDKPGLLKELFDNGCSSESRFSWKFNDSDGTEHTSPLLWLLCQGNEGTDVGIVDMLLERGGNSSLTADMNFRTSRSGITPLIMATSSSRAGIVSRLLQAGADPDAQDAAERTPLQYATMASNVECMECLLTYQAEVNDESLHIAARQLDLAAVKLLLNHHARTDLPGSVHCGDRTPLAELCRMADITRNPSQLKKTLVYLCEATTNLRMLTHAKSLIYQALDNPSPIKMTTALLASCPSIGVSLNDDFNILSMESCRYSPTGYVRHLMCVESPSQRSLDFARRCCTQSDCPAPKLENLLHAHGCRDRFWDANSGANQPKGFRNPPMAIIDAIEEAKAMRKEEARKEKIQKDLDAAAESDRRRERERLKLLQEKRAAELHDLKERAAAETRAIQQQAMAEEQKIRRITAAEAAEAEERRQIEQREHDAKRERRKTEFYEQEAREEERDKRIQRTLREKTNIQVDQKKREANIRKDLIKEERGLIGEKRRLTDSATSMFKEAGYAGVSQASMGKVLGEIEQ